MSFLLISNLAIISFVAVFRERFETAEQRVVFVDRLTEVWLSMFFFCLINVLMGGWAVLDFHASMTSEKNKRCC